MYIQTRLLALALAGVAALTLPGCASMRVNSFVERGADFSRYRTFDWAPVDRFETGDPRLDNNPFFQERVRAAVEQQMTQRGFEKTSEAPDLVLHYHANVSEKIDINLIDRNAPNCLNGADDCRPYKFEAGTLLLDFFDARTNALVWRGWAEDSMDGAIDNQRAMEQEIDKAVTRILQRLPSHL